MVTLIPVADREELTTKAAEQTAKVIANAQQSGDGYARIVLTGGGAGIGMLQKLRELDGIDWARIHIFFGDERNVPTDHPDSNEGQARAALLDHVSIPQEHIHGWRLGELSLDAAVTAYAGTLSKYAPQGFDLHLLGMGGEGHINSIFPHTDAVREQNALTLAVTDSPKPPAERATLTLPAIAQADHVWLLVSGAEKAEAASHVIAGSPAEDWPAAGAHGRVETLLILSEDARI
ncbi:6-phosphogluconolactonase [Corynebacterium freiburgense]|uniref:6-phosphogluconolactonase n=1 Tax=Corynebacterium freiburgense TaxID=556548 RepID=UPI000405F12D|nr:6-phosphogluconolactonase [Corynebacterium freiburgense]WJZ02716.1 6-phosphogluconolactonase [Corynebacterium freiburgense]